MTIGHLDHLVAICDLHNANNIASRDKVSDLYACNVSHDNFVTMPLTQPSDAPIGICKQSMHHKKRKDDHKSHSVHINV